MAIKRVFLIAVSLSIALLSLVAQEDLPPGVAIAEDNYFEIEEDGNPRFMQVLSWKAQDYALQYELEIRDSTGAEIYRQISEENTQTVSLTAGAYRWRVTVYNLLGKKDVSGQWQDLLVVKVEVPRITGFSPETLYIEDGNFIVTLEGRNLTSDSRIFLAGTISGIAWHDVTVMENDRGRRVVFSLDAEKLDGGIFTITVVHPSGLRTQSKNTLRIRYQNNQQFFASLAWAPVIPLWDAFYTDTWSEGFYPVGLDAAFSWMFVRRKVSYMGAELRVGAVSMDGGDERALLETTQSRLSLAFAYKRILTPPFFIVLRAGVGLAFTNMVFSYDGVEGTSLATMDPLVCLGLSGQYLFTKHLFAELSLEAVNVLYDGANALSLIPALGLGYLF